MSMQELESNATFKDLVAQKRSGTGEKVADYKGIVVYKYRDDRESYHLRALENFKKISGK